MAFDLSDRLSELSISSSNPHLFLSKKCLSFNFNSEEFEQFGIYKYSSRILLNYKDLVALNAKAGSFVKIYSNGI
jgi:hypothetical protein